MKCKLTFLLLILVITPGLSFADVAPPYPYMLSQPDGFTFEARMFGDEHLNWVETMDGRIILDVLDDENDIWWYYATVDSEGFYAPSPVLAGTETAGNLFVPPDRADALEQGARKLKGKFRHAADIDRPDLSIPFASPLVASGVCKPIIFLVDFPGSLPGQMPGHKYTKGQFVQLLFANGLNPYGVTPSLPGTYNTSVRDYFDEVSGGKFAVSGSSASVADWTTTDNSYGYYVDEAQGTGRGPNGRTHSAAAVCVEVARKLDNAVNYANFDGNRDGVVDVVILVMEGWAISGATSTFWSFRSSLYSVSEIDPTAPTDSSGFLLLDGVTIRQFIVTTEQVYGVGWPDFNQGDIRPIGTFCHEMGHVLGLPDLYDTDYIYDPNKTETIWSSGIGDWGLMGSGNYNRQTSPAYLCAWSRARLNWITVQTYATNLSPMAVSVPPTENNHVAYKILIDPSNTSEYFLLENRQRIGSDAYLYGKGLLIWHIDENFTDMFPGVNRVNSWESTFGVSLMQADGMGHLYKDRDGPGYNDGDPGDPFPGSTLKNRFTVGTNPSSSSYQYDRDGDGTVDTGYASEVSITNITESADGVISCTVSSPNPRGFEIRYDGGSYTGHGWSLKSFVNESDEDRAGILVTPLKSSYLRSVGTVFIKYPTHQVTSYAIRVWEGFERTTRRPQALIHEQSGSVDWTASHPPRKEGGWATIPINRDISCRSGSEYYIEIQYTGSGRTMPFCYSGDTGVSPSGKSFIRGSGTIACEPWLYGDWNIRAVFEEVAEPTSLTVTSPNGGESWQQGTTHAITWTSSGNVGSNVKIELFKGAALHNTIHSSAPNSGSYNWQIPSTQTPGSDYKVRITSTLNPAYYDESDRPFSITSAALPTITVTYPNGGESLQQGAPLRITWTWTGNPGPDVWIQLTKGGSPSTIVQASTPNDGSYDYQILPDQVPGPDYKILVRSTTNASCYDESDRPFSITGTGLPSITVTPSEGLASAGNQGGPFSPSSKTYTLTNTGGSSLNWQASKSQAWVSFSQASGTLAAGGSTPLTVSINSNATGLGAGSYSDTVYFTNLTNNNGSTTRPVSLQISAAQKVATPTFSPAGGTYPSALTVTISCATSGATIRYTRDGSTPTETSTLYSAPISITTTTTLKAKAWKSGWTASDVGTAVYTIQSNGIVILEDTWPSERDDATKWTTHGTEVDNRGENEPSPPYSLHFNTGDSIRSKKIDLSGYSRAVLTYYYERGGTCEPPDDGDDFASMYWDGSSYKELRRHLGSGPVMYHYEKVTVALPTAAMHRNFMLRFEARGDSYWYGEYDDWFLDDVELRVWP